MSEDRFVTLDTPLGDDVLLFESLEAREALSTPFKFTLRVLSEDPDLDLSELLGESVTVRVRLPDGSVREFSGIVVSFSLVGASLRYARYTLLLRPWLWLLSQHSDCRIHQQLSVPEIILETFRRHGFSDFENALTGEYKPLEYSVQYRESDLNYVSRLLEREGIYYYFKHQDKKHILVLVDASTAHTAVPGYEEVVYHPEQGAREGDYIDFWRVSRQVCSAGYATTDFDFERPQVPLHVKRQAAHSYQEFEVFEYPGEYLSLEDGERLAQVRLEALQANQEVVEGAGPVAGLAAGAVFSLTQFPREDQNRRYLVVSASHSIKESPYESERVDEAGYYCSFQAIDAGEPFRPPRRARRSKVEGPQTAIVVGKQGEDLWTDEHGRVKVQFHWDRYGEANENSSCWVRVAHFWAGSGFGAQFLPRIGQEVIVEFLEGDPDRPIITGRVYNGQNAVPYALPGQQTQSGIKTRSSKDGNPSNANEIRFEDKRGSEQLYVQAEKNLDTLVKASETHTVGSDRAIAVGNDETHSVGSNQTLDIGADRTETVGGDELVTIGGSRTAAVMASETISVGSERTTMVATLETLTVGAAQSITVGGMRTLSVAGAEAINIGAAQTLEITGNLSVSVGGKRSSDVGSNEDISIQGERTQTIGKDDKLSVGKKLVINAGDEIVIKAGQASISLKKNGDISLKGKNIQLNGSGKVNVKGGQVTLKGRKITNN